MNLTRNDKENIDQKNVNFQFFLTKFILTFDFAMP